MSWNGVIVGRPHQVLGYTTRELADAFGVCTRTIQRMRKDGKLPYIMVGSRPRFPRQAIKKMLQAGHNMKVTG